TQGTKLDSDQLDPETNSSTAQCFVDHGAFTDIYVSSPGGRHVRAALHMCSFCDLPKTKIQNLEMSSWNSQSSDNHIKWAHLSRDADTPKEQQQIFWHCIRFWGMSEKAETWQDAADYLENKDDTESESSSESDSANAQPFLDYRLGSNAESSDTNWDGRDPSASGWD
ncbi:hypothetical protein VP01_10393g1, partial [Puccinia sorghi]